MTLLEALLMLKQTREASPCSCCHQGSWVAAGAGEEVLLGGGSKTSLTEWRGPSSAVPCFYLQYFQG